MNGNSLKINEQSGDVLSPIISKKETLIDKRAREQNSIYTAGAPPMTALPFGPKEWPHVKNEIFYLDLVGKNLNGESQVHNRNYNKIYRLPEIQKIRYLNIDSLSDNKCKDGQTIDRVLKLTKYRYRLPDFGDFQCFYMGNSGYNPDWDYTPNFITNCSAYIYQPYGYLILYQKAIKEAIVLDVFHTYYVDSVHDRIFYIDEKFNIYLRDNGYTDGEEGRNGQIPTELGYSELRKISFSKTGEINILRLK